jgi:serine/threonine-protein kinase
MGIVYEGWDPGIERRVALKTVRPDQLDSSEAKELAERFRREAQAAGQLSHPSIVSVYDFGQEADISFIAMEFIEGEELQDRLDRGERLTIPEVVEVMTQLLDALETAGRAGVVHRDIKPANILLLPNGRVKVADFGIARVEASGLTQDGSMLGTPAYMSPEQLNGVDVDPRSDLFSAGVVFYQTLTGEKPFTGNRVATIIRKIIEYTPPDPSTLDLGVPATFDAVIRKAIAKTPDDRYQSGAEFAEAIRAAARV